MSVPTPVRLLLLLLCAGILSLPADAQAAAAPGNHSGELLSESSGHAARKNGRSSRRSRGRSSDGEGAPTSGDDDLTPPLSPLPPPPLPPPSAASTGDLPVNLPNPLPPADANNASTELPPPPPPLAPAAVEANGAAAAPGQPQGDVLMPRTLLSDHAQFMGRNAVGAYNLVAMPIGSSSDASAVAPAGLGLRHWFRGNGAGGVDVGVDVGLGLTIAGSSSSSKDPGGTTTTVPVPSTSVISAHLGLPVALYAGRHYALEVIPELDLGYAWGHDVNLAGAAGKRASGYLVRLGGRVGPEITLGYFGIPELSLQPSVGLYLSHNGLSSGQIPAGAETDSSFTALATVQAISVATMNVFFYF